MQSVKSSFNFPKNLISECVDNKKFEKRYTALMNSMCSFVDSFGYKSKVEVNPMVLGIALVDYFEDIHRLKTFHKVEHINSIKIVSYISYWLLRRKPIQIKSTDVEAVYANEQFVMAYILDFLESSENGKIVYRENAALEAFTEYLFYYLKYRSVDARSIEMMIMSFFAGQVYQEKDNDISDLLPEHDHM